ncbi:MAG TPA: alkaline phosphatase D family protein [Actinomycetota bacterium]|nr:alkaline phosphatase D family protein [Actinomycetota bacterium]
MPPDPDAADRLLIGPVLRRVVGTRATVWVETATPAVVRVTAGTAAGEAHTFTAFGHHYAIVVVKGLTLGAVAPYEVWLDGARAWPEAGDKLPPSVIRTRSPDEADQPVRMVFGSCRESTQHASGRRLPPDALDAYARRLAKASPVDGAGAPASGWPDLLLLLGDQVYADITSPRVRRWLRRRRRRADAPTRQVVSFHEYTGLYLESWRDPEIRWLLSTVPSVMIFDDHEIIDDWNSSAAWRDDMRSRSWWGERIASGLASYWVYQHLGNLSPDEIAADPIYAKVVAAGDATEVLREFGERVDKEADVGHDPQLWRGVEYQWSFALDLGRTRIVVLDNRCSRVLEPAHRSMLPEDEWQWLTDRVHGDYDHLVVGSSLPWLLPPGVHHLEAWNERITESSRRWIAAAGETLRRAVDLEHWAAFRLSFERLAQLFAELGTDAQQPGEAVGVGAGPPRSISVLSGDVHHSYVARADLGPEVSSPIHQLTCSPLHNQVPAIMRPPLRLGWGRSFTALTGMLARSAGLRPPVVRWRRLAGPYFGNAVSTLVHSGQSARVTIEGTTSDGNLRTVAEVPLSAG